MKGKWSKRILLLTVGMLLFLAIFAEDFVNLYLRSYNARRAAIYYSYYREASMGKVPMPKYLVVTGWRSGQPPIEVKIQSTSGETLLFDAVMSNDGSQTNWVFLPK